VLAHIAAWLPHLRQILYWETLFSLTIFTLHVIVKVLVHGSAIEGDTGGQFEAFSIILWAWRPSWSLRYDRLRRLKRRNIFSIRYV
jgi:hypothetical protein